MKIGFIKTSKKENERRIPLLPRFIQNLPLAIRKDLYFELGYGLDNGLSDDSIKKLECNILSRSEIFKVCDIVVLPKPLLSDLHQMKQSQVLFGWPHCVQQVDIAQVAINKKLSFIAWEAMYAWSEKDEKGVHTFYRNNEIAGYAAVHHALNLFGMDGVYGQKLSAAIIGYGSVSRGAVNGLKARGYNEITVFSRRLPSEIRDRQVNIDYKYFSIENGDEIVVTDENGTKTLMIDELAKKGIIVNGIMQDPVKPINYVTKNNIDKISDNTLIIDISCDEKMGFYFAKPTSFEHPVFAVERNINYYAVDHTPTYLHQAASHDISLALLPFIQVLHGGYKSWILNKTISHAIEILNGEILNPKIIQFQNREAHYPYLLKK